MFFSSALAKASAPASPILVHRLFFSSALARPHARSQSPILVTGSSQVPWPRPLRPQSHCAVSVLLKCQGLCARISKICSFTQADLDSHRLVLLKPLDDNPVLLMCPHLPCFKSMTTCVMFGPSSSNSTFIALLSIVGKLRQVLFHAHQQRRTQRTGTTNVAHQTQATTSADSSWKICSRSSRLFTPRITAVAVHHSRKWTVTTRSGQAL